MSAFIGYKLHEFEQRLDRIEALLSQLVQQGEVSMARDQEILELVEQINVNTNQQAEGVAAVRARLEALAGEIANGTTAAGSETIVARLRALVDTTQVIEDNLRDMGADPSDPTPEPTPIPEPAPEPEPEPEPAPEPAPAPEPDGQQ